MDVCVISRDGKLRAVCREIWTATSQRDWCLLTAEPDDITPTASLYIWDFDPSVSLPSPLQKNPTRNLYLVERDHVAAFHTCIGRTDVSVLLKPVSRNTLTAFVGLAVAAHNDRVSTTTGIRAERDEILQCLIEANLKLQQFDQDRTKFLARAFHDIRSPLTAIAGYCDLLLTGALGPLHEEHKDIVLRMSRSTQRLSQMSSAIYELSLGQQLRGSVHDREADIDSCIIQALHEALVVATPKDISITTKIDPVPGRLFFDEAAIEHVLSHLLDNACKFMGKGGAIELSAYPFFWERRRSPGLRSPGLRSPGGDRRRLQSPHPNAYRIDIVHTGAPIPDEHLSTVFEETADYGGGNDRSRGGLGLAVCRMTLVRHNGHIWAENRTMGPAFSFVLPVRGEKPAGWRPSEVSEEKHEHDTGK